MAETPRKELDALDLLMQDHREIESLFREFEHVQQDHEAAALVIENACAELEMHDKLENEIFYPAISEAAADDEIEDLLVDAEDAHDTVLEMIEELEQIETDDVAKRHAHFIAIVAQVKQHILDEETALFPKVQKIEQLDLEALGAELHERRSELMTEPGLAKDGAVTA
jgi:iron-sulfur cluster repair protein YtfE (RIC family)